MSKIDINRFSFTIRISKGNNVLNLVKYSDEFLIYTFMYICKEFDYSYYDYLKEMINLCLTSKCTISKDDKSLVIVLYRLPSCPFRIKSIDDFNTYLDKIDKFLSYDKEVSL